MAEVAGKWPADCLPIMLKWLTDKRVPEFYEGRDARFTMDTLSARYSENRQGS